MAIQERLTRLDWLGVLWWGLVAALLFTGGLTLVQVTVAPSGAFTVLVPLDQAGTLAGPGRLPDGVSVQASAHVRALVEEPTATQTLLHMATSLPTKCVILGMLFILMRIVREARRGDPFTAGNVRLLRLLGLTLIVGGLAADVVEEIAYRELVGPIVDGPVGGFFWSGWWLTGVAFLAIAEVFKRGVRMRTELDGVI